MHSNDRYNQRGVSAQKEDVHRAVAALDKGLFPHAFCKIYPDYLGGREDKCLIMHADGAGTKSSLAYLYWKETGDLSVWEGIAVDAIVMNLDDMICVGATGPFTYSSTIGRNKMLIPAEVLSAIINGSQRFLDRMQTHGIDIKFLGGETADVGDLVRTIIVDGTMAASMPRTKVINPANITEGDVIVSFASYGQATYEDEYNSGMGSNGLTSARHEMLHHSYKTKYPESVDPNVADELVYNGQHFLTDKTDVPLDIGKMILSPTRTYAPMLLPMLQQHHEAIHAIIHCSGGGQSKVLHYLNRPLRVVKNNLLPIPPLFELIQKSAGTSWQEMYQVFNMGQRLEIYTDEKTAQQLIAIAAQYNIAAQISGYVAASATKEVLIETAHGGYRYA